MNEKDLIYVKYIADTCSISKAAKELYISQPSLSQALQKIENEVGTPLFKRNPNGMKLTLAGEKYYLAAKEILDIYNDFKSDVTYINNLEKGRLIIGSARIMGSYLLPKALANFLDKYPNIEIYIEEHYTSVLENMILDGKIDMAITHNHPYSKKPGIHYDILYKDKFIIVAKKNHKIKKFTKFNNTTNKYEISIKDLEDEKFVVLNKGQGIRNVSDILWNESNYKPNIVLTSKDFSTVLNLTIMGMGISLLPVQYTKIFSSSKNFDTYNITETENNYWNSVILTRANAYKSKICEEFIKEIKLCYENNDPI